MIAAPVNAMLSISHMLTHVYHIPYFLWSKYLQQRK